MDVLFMDIILTMLISKREINNLVIIYYTIYSNFIGPKSVKCFRLP